MLIERPPVAPGQALSQALRPEEPVHLGPNKRYLLRVEEDAGSTASRQEEQGSYPLTMLLRLATNLGATDLAERHDDYARPR